MLRISTALFLLPLSFLLADEAAKPPVRTDLYGDPLPEGAIARLGTIRFRQDYMTYCAAFSPDGKKIACGGAWNGVAVYDAATGRAVLTVKRPGQVLGLAYSRDGALLAISAGGNGNTRLLDATTGQTVAELGEAQDVVFSFAFSPDGKTLAGAERDGAVHLWNAATGQEVRKFPHDGGVWSVAYAPDGKSLASAGRDKLVHLWDPVNGNEIRQLTGHQQEVVCVAFAPDGKLLASASAETTVRLWDPTSGNTVRTLESKNGPVDYVVFSPDGRSLVCGNHDGTIQFWDPATGVEQRRWQAHGAAVKQLAFSADGKRLVTASPWECGPVIWDAATGERVPPLVGHSTPIDFLAFAPDGQSVFTNARLDSRILSWDLASAKPRTIAKWDNSLITCCAVTADGRTAATLGRKDKTLRFWDLTTGQARTFGPFDSGIGAISHVLAFSHDGKTLALGDTVQGVNLIDVAKGQQIARLEGPPGQTSNAQFSPNGKVLAASIGSAPSTSLLLWNIADGRRLAELTVNGDIFSLTFSPNSRLLAISGGYSDGARLWNPSTGKSFPLPTDSRGGIYGLAFAPDGRFIAGTGDDRDQRVHVWEVASRKEVLQFSGHITGALSAAFSPDGQKLASGGADSTILLWDAVPWRHAPRAAMLSDAEVQTAWRDLTGTDAVAACEVIWTLAAVPSQAMPLLKQLLKPVRAVPEERLRRLTNELGSDQFAVREQATRELETLGSAAEAFLRRELKEKLTLESRRRIERLLDRHDNEPLPGVNLAMCRGLELLEQIGNAEARQLLSQLSEGLPEAALTQESRLILERLAGH